MFKIVIAILAIVSCAFPQKGFTPDYFVKKHDLKLPVVDEKNIDVSKHTHKSDSWFYFYQGKTDRVDSVFRFLNIERFPANKQYEKYHYNKDSVIISMISIAQDEMDTTNSLQITFTNNYLTKTYFDYKDKCFDFVKFTPWGRRKSEKRLCPGNKESQGQDFDFIKKQDYLEGVETNRGVKQLDNIRRYYFTEFDSLCAEFISEQKTPPIIIYLYFYTPTKLRKYEYGFGLYANNNEVTEFSFYSYMPNGKLYRIYYFSMKDRLAKEKTYELSNYTEYTYDSLGRKISMITRVVPDEKEKK
jgi:hypothetical protein